MIESRRNSKRRNILVAVAGLLMATAIGQYIFTRSSTTPEKNKPQVKAVDKAAVEKFMEEAAAMAPDLSVTREPLAIIERDRTGRPLTYLIEATKTNEYWFKVADYQLQNAGDWSALDPASLASAIDRAYAKRTTFPAEMTGSGSVSASAGPISGEITLPLPIRAIGEMLGVIRGAIKLDVDRVDIAIKGYADGEVSNTWHPPVPNLPVAYHEFPVLRTIDESKVNWTFYRKGEYLRTVTFPYSNADLPDLRAQFVRHDFVEDVVTNTANATRCHIYVLHNKPIQDARQAQLRKVQIYVMVYLRVSDEKG